jgi:hypothetical protein
MVCSGITLPCLYYFQKQGQERKLCSKLNSCKLIGFFRWPFFFSIINAPLLQVIKSGVSETKTSLSVPYWTIKHCFLSWFIYLFFINCLASKCWMIVDDELGWMWKGSGHGLLLSQHLSGRTEENYKYPQL